MEHTTALMPLVIKHWRLLALSALAAAAVAFALTSTMSPTYEARTQLLVGPLNTDLRTLQAAGELSRTYAELATSRPILDQAIRRARVDTTADELKDAGAATATSNQITRVVDIAVQQPDPEGAARLANAIGDRIKFVTTDAPSQNEEVIESFGRQEGVTALPEADQRAVERAARKVLGQSLAGSVAIVDPATAPTEPSAPATRLMTILAGLAGLVLAGVFVLARASSADSIEDERDLAELGGTAVLGSVDAPRSRDPARALAVETTPDSPGAERYRLLAAKAGFLDGRRPVRSVLVVDAGDGVAAGVVAANLAAVLAEADRRVLLIDTGGSPAGVSRLFGLEGRPGYGDLLIDLVADGALNGRLDELPVQRGEDLAVLPSGRVAPPGLLDVERATSILEPMLERVDVVLVATPPIDRSPTALVWARVTQGTIVVADEGRTARDSVGEVIGSLGLVGANVLGTVLGRDARGSLLRVPAAAGRRRG